MVVLGIRNPSNSLQNEKELKILVTGHTGLVGTSLVKKLQSEYTVVTSNRDNGKRIDVLEKTQLEGLENLDAVIHLASKTSVSDSISNPYETYYTNIVGTLNVLDWAKNNNVNKIINVSTYLYGNPQYIPIDENHPLGPHSPYNKSKLISEKLCEYYAKDYELKVVTLRPFYIYGPSNNLSFLSSVIRKVITNERIILSNKNIRRDFVFVDDFVNLVYRILLNFPEGYNVYNVGYGKSYTLEEILSEIECIINKKIAFEYDYSLRPNDIGEMVADIDKVQKQFKWTPGIDIHEGLRLTIDRYQEMIKNDKY
jgi:UDP-glucose 4-epimerase